MTMSQVDAKRGVLKLHKLLRKMKWEISKLHIYQSMQTIQSMQFQKGKMVHVQLQPHRVFLKGIPSTAMDNTQLAVSKKDLTK